MRCVFHFPEDSGLQPVSVEADAPAIGGIIYFSEHGPDHMSKGAEFHRVGRRWRVSDVNYSVMVFTDKLHCIKVDKPDTVARCEVHVIAAPEGGEGENG